MNIPSSHLENKESLPTDNFQRFLHRLDHELKNPLTAIRFALANLSSMVEGEAAQSAVKSIMTQTLRISQIIKDVRKLADLEQLQIERIPVNVVVLLNEAILHVQPTPDPYEFTITLSTETLTPDLTIKGDKYLLLLAIFNILENAIKFSGAGGKINVQAFEAPPMLIIRISDNGCGIAVEDLGLVWEELYRAPATRHLPGSGLGLAMVKAIIDRHGGTVSLESTLGNGTTVTIALPLDH